MSDLKKIETLDREPFKNMVATIGNLPTSFVDSMSYFDMLAWLCDYIQNKIVPALNDNIEIVDNLSKEFVSLKQYVEEQVDDIAQLRIDFEEFTANVNQIVEDLQEEVRGYVQTQLNQFRIAVELVLSQMSEALNSKIDTEVERLDEKIDNIAVKNVIVFNASLGVYQTLQETLDYLFEYQRTEAITAKEYDDLELTAKTYDDKLITAFDYDNFGKTILMSA